MSRGVRFATRGERFRSRRGEDGASGGWVADRATSLRCVLRVFAALSEASMGVAIMQSELLEEFRCTGKNWLPVSASSHRPPVTSLALMLPPRIKLFAIDASDAKRSFYLRPSEINVSKVAQLATIPNPYLIDPATEKAILPAQNGDFVFDFDPNLEYEVKLGIDTERLGVLPG